MLELSWTEPSVTWWLRWDWPPKDFSELWNWLLWLPATTSWLLLKLWKNMTHRRQKS